MFVLSLLFHNLGESAKCVSVLHIPDKFVNKTTASKETIPKEMKDKYVADITHFIALCKFYSNSTHYMWYF